MRNAGKIIPFERCWIPQGYKLMGFVTSIDGAKCGYGTTIHVLGEKEDDNGEDDTGLRRRLVMTDSKICKRTVSSHEALAGKLGSEALFTLLQPLLYDHGGASLLLPFKGDNSCFLAMLNPQVELKNVLLQNAVEG